MSAATAEKKCGWRRRGDMGGMDACMLPEHPGDVAHVFPPLVLVPPEPSIVLRRPVGLGSVVCCRTEVDGSGATHAHGEGVFCELCAHLAPPQKEVASRDEVFRAAVAFWLFGRDFTLQVFPEFEGYAFPWERARRAAGAAGVCAEPCCGFATGPLDLFCRKHGGDARACGICGAVTACGGHP